MEDIKRILAENILKYRKQCVMTQEEVAEQLGVSFQAVSKWENAKAAPDIAFYRGWRNCLIALSIRCFQEKKMP